MQRGQLWGSQGRRGCLQLLQEAAELLASHQRLHPESMCSPGEVQLSPCCSSADLDVRTKELGTTFLSMQHLIVSQLISTLTEEAGSQAATAKGHPVWPGMREKSSYSLP